MSYAHAKAVSNGSSAVLYMNEDGSKVIRSGGSRAWRNNNPGNMRYSVFSKSHGAIGSAGGFAVFPDLATGRAALSALLHGQPYITLTIYDAIERYAPPKENDPDNYRKLIATFTGLDVHRKLNELTAAEFENVLNAIQRVEGYVVGTEKPVRRVLGAKTEGRRLIAFLIEGETSYISKHMAISMADRQEIDAIVVRPKNGEAYLRAVPDGVAGNNLYSLAITKV